MSGKRVWQLINRPPKNGSVRNLRHTLKRWIELSANRGAYKGVCNQCIESNTLSSSSKPFFNPMKIFTPFKASVLMLGLAVAGG